MKIIPNKRVQGFALKANSVLHDISLNQLSVVYQGFIIQKPKTYLFNLLTIDNETVLAAVELQKRVF